MTRATLKRTSLGLALLLIAACGSPTTSAIKKTAGIGDEGKICTQIAVTSLTVTVNVPSGWDADELSNELQVTGTVDKKPISFPDPEVNQAQLYYRLYEQTGSFDVTVKLRSTSESLTNFVVKEDSSGCHAEARAILVEFLPPNRISIGPMPKPI